MPEPVYVPEPACVPGARFFKKSSEVSEHFRPTASGSGSGSSGTNLHQAFFYF